MTMGKNCFTDFYRRRRIWIMSLLILWLWAPVLLLAWLPAGRDSGLKSHVKIKAEALLRAARIENLLNCSLGAAESLKFTKAEALDIEDNVAAAAVFILRRDYDDALLMLWASGSKIENNRSPEAALVCCLDSVNEKEEYERVFERKALEYIFKTEDVNKKILILKALWLFRGSEYTITGDDGSVSSGSTVKSECGKDYPITEEAYEINYRCFLRDIGLVCFAFIFISAALLSGAFLAFNEANNFWVWFKTGKNPRNETENPQIPSLEFLPSFSLFVFINWLSVFSAVILGFILKRIYYSEIIGTVELQIIIYAVNLTVIAYKLPQLTVKRAEEKGGSVISLREICGFVGLGSFKKAYLFEAFGGYGLALAAAFLLSWVTSAVLGGTPHSSNVLLDNMLNGNIYEYAAVFILVLAGPFYEEIFFRGILFGGLKSVFNISLAAAAASLAFSLCHGDSQGLLVLTGLGAVFCWLYQRSRSLWPSILAHMLWNGGIAVYLFVLLYL